MSDDLSSYRMPFYLALDVSRAAQRLSPHYRSGLYQLSTELARRPELARLTSIATAAIDDGCRWTRLLPPSRISLLPPAIPSNAGYPAFDRMAIATRAQIDADLASYRADQLHCFRPALIVLAASAGSIGQWRSAFGDLTWYDSASGSGNRSYPVVLPVCFGEEIATELAGMVHPSGTSRLLVFSDTSDAMACVYRAFEVVSSFIVESVRTLATGAPRHVYPNSDAPQANRLIPVPPEPTARALQVTARSEQAQQSGGASYVSLSCQRNGASMVAEFRRKGAGWQLVSTNLVSSGSPTAAKVLTGAFAIAPTYSGCANCSNDSITVCSCGQLSCWDGLQRMVRCVRCRMTATVAGNITRLQAID